MRYFKFVIKLKYLGSYYFKTLTVFDGPTKLLLTTFVNKFVKLRPLN